MSCLNEMSPYLSRAFSVIEMQNINIKFFHIARSRYPSSVRTLKGFFFFTWASIKPGTWNIPEHSGTFRNIPEHEKIKIFFYEKIIN